MSDQWYFESATAKPMGPFTLEKLCKWAARPGVT